MSSQTVFLTSQLTSVTFDVALVGNAQGTSPGNPVTGLTYQSVQAYTRTMPVGTSTQIPLVTLAAVTSAFSAGGFKEVVASITGKGVFARMKFESGVHRVQRVPETENQGRIHTSAATVAVLPEAEDIDIEIRPEDIRIDTMRASGAGGQHVNTPDSAVRVTHIPTGIIVTSSEKSQHQNRARAMQVLRARLYDMERTKAAEARAAERKDQIGSGDRSQRIRTYNYPQGRVTDHRVNVTLYNLPQIMEGEGLDTIVDALITEHQASLLASEDGKVHA